MSTRVNCFLLLVIIGICAGCANITAPSGGKRDRTPPKLLSIDPHDSLLNTKVKRIEMHFDEFITASDVSKEVQISPILSISPSVVALNKHVVTKIVDSLLEDNTTYRISYGNAIKDVHEGNPFSHYTYTFSTGTYFDSLILQGTIISALTGQPDTSGIVELYSDKDNDSAVVRHKPKYVTKADAKGSFIFKGLPKRNFRIYALKDLNGNLIYDGPAPGELIAFNDKAVTPGDTTQPAIVLRMFGEVADTVTKKSVDTLKKDNKDTGVKTKSKQTKKDSLLVYTVNIDSSNAANRTFDITRDIKLVFNRMPVLNKEKIKLTYDDDGNTESPAISFVTDSLRPKELHIKTKWLENTVYTLHLSKGFAKDTSGVEVKPSRYVFRTDEEEDYGKIKVHLPTKYNDRKYLLLVATDADTIYQEPVTDTLIPLSFVRPGVYTFRIIVDKNGNGKWDTGDLLAKLQPEEIIPYTEPLSIKPGWENIIDFEQKPKPKPPVQKTAPK